MECRRSVAALDLLVLACLYSQMWDNFVSLLITLMICADPEVLQRQNEDARVPRLRIGAMLVKGLHRD